MIVVENETDKLSNAESGQMRNKSDTETQREMEDLYKFADLVMPIFSYFLNKDSHV